MEERDWRWIRNAIMETGIESVEDLIKHFDQQIFEEKCIKYELELENGVYAHRHEDRMRSIDIHRKNLGGVFIDNGWKITI